MVSTLDCLIVFKVDVDVWCLHMIVWLCLRLTNGVYAWLFDCVYGWCTVSMLFVWLCLRLTVWLRLWLMYDDYGSLYLQIFQQFKLKPHYVRDVHIKETIFRLIAFRRIGISLGFPRCWPDWAGKWLAPVKMHCNILLVQDVWSPYIRSHHERTHQITGKKC